MMRKHTFNLIEILMALGVLMIGVVSIMGLFPVASKVTSDAAMETYVPNALEEVAAMIREQTARPGEWDTWITATNSKIPKDQPSGMLGVDSEDKLVEKIENASLWTRVAKESCPYLFKLDGEAGVFQLISVRGYNGEPKDFKLDDDSDKIESRVLICVWHDPIRRVLIKDGASKPYGDKYGVRINIKAGWPAERPEALINASEATPLRRIRVLSFDLLNPNP